MIDRVPPEHVTIIENNKDKDTYVDRTLTTEQMYIHFRCAIPPFKDNPTLRKAIAYAIDKEAIVDSIMGGDALVSDSYIAPKQFGYEPARNIIQYDPDKAKQLLAEAGYPGGKGLPELEFITPVGFYPKTKEYAEFITASLQELGLKIKLVTLETAAWNEKYYVADAGHMIIGGWVPHGPDVNGILPPHFGSPGSPGLVNYVSDSEIDAAMDLQTRTTDPNKRIQAIRDLNVLLADKVPSYPILVSTSLSGVSTKVKNLHMLPNTFFFFENIELEE